MREILFRGKCVDNGEWIGGYLYKVWDKAYLLWGSINDIPDTMEIIPETAGQYIGLTDNNGKKIFEGDIVVTNKFGTPNRKYVIVYDDEIATYIGEGKRGCCRYFTTFSGDADAFEVIGNIHDNPELLKGGEG